MTQRPSPNRPRRTKLLKRLGCLSCLGVFSSGMTLAQASPLTSSPASVTVSPSPAAVEPTPPAPSATVVPTTPAPAPAVPESATPDPTPPVQIEIPKSSPVSESPLVAPSPAASPAPKYEPPSSIVIEKRNSGTTTTPKATTPPKTTGIANAVSNAVSGVMRPKFNPTQPEVTAEAQAAPETASSWTPPSIVPPSFVQDYFNRTVRPLGMPGNGDVRLLFPLSIPSAITSAFGWRIHPITGNQRLHTGTDLGAPMGTPVLAALTGRVIMAEFFGGYGLSIALEHTNGSQQTLYAHLSEIFVKPGDVVKQGTVIGRVGSTGNSTGPHLHFEFRQQTQEGGWVAQDAGLSLEQAVAQLARSMQVTQQTQPQTQVPQ
ncbi:peptidoglycan DD-metalloendopeptidase family protein [Leptolyngbya sp. AN03gr2]|uniref:M23 family metallopeptidase n=1 Tax=unclassified Leptolyngbya TaxID=2650499 RepID=UPI003D31D3E3